MNDKKSLNLRRDTLTNCYATEGFNPFLIEMESNYVATRSPFSILIMDVDRFKLFNDKHGHLNGDEVLKYFSSALRLDLEDEVNIPFRYGGDEFVVVFPGKTANEAFALAQRLRKNMRTRSCIIRGRQQKVTFSGGIACYPVDAKTRDSLFERADKALYYSKKHGRAKVTRYHEMKMKMALQVLTVFVLIFSTVAFWTLSTSTLQPLLDQAISKTRTYCYKARSYLRLPAWSSANSAHEPLSTALPVSEAPVSPPLVVVPVVLPEPAKPRVSKVYLTTGKSIQGVKVAESDEWVKLQLGLDEGKGSVKIKKTQIVRIEETP